MRRNANASENWQNVKRKRNCGYNTSKKRDLWRNNVDAKKSAVLK